MEVPFFPAPGTAQGWRKNPGTADEEVIENCLVSVVLQKAG